MIHTTRILIDIRGSLNLMKVHMLGTHSFYEEF